MTYFTCFSLLLSVVFSPAMAQNAPTDWLFSYAFDGNAKDDGPNKNDGQIVGEVMASENRFGEKDRALFFNGDKAGYIRIPFSNTLNLPVKGFTFSVWINLIDYHKTGYWDLVKTDKYAPIFCKSENEQFFQYRLCLTSEGYLFDGLKNNYVYGAWYTQGAVVKRKTWQQLTVTYDNTVFRLYVDGALKHTVDFINNFVVDHNNLVIGRDIPGALEYFNGYMDDMKIWDRALSVNEAAALYRVMSAKALDTLVTVAEVPAVKETFAVKEGESIVLKNVLFVQSKTELLPSSYPELEKLIETMIQHPAIKIEVAGHTDNQGEREKNIELSENRAKVIKDYLVEKGIEDKRITAIGYGPDKPINKNKNETERKLNRRVEFTIKNK